MAKSIRLNKKLRNEISSNIRQAYKLKTPPPAHKSKGDWFSEILKPLMRKIYLEDVQATKDKINAAGLSDLKIVSDYRFTYAVDGDFADSVYHSDNDTYAKDNFHPILRQGTYFNLTKDMEGELGDAYREYLAASKGLKQSKEKLDKYNLKLANYMADVDNVLEGVNTTYQLLEAWPECERFIPSTVVDPSGIQLPASVSISQLNKSI